MVQFLKMVMEPDRDKDGPSEAKDKKMRGSLSLWGYFIRIYAFYGSLGWGVYWKYFMGGALKSELQGRNSTKNLINTNRNAEGAPMRNEDGRGRPKENQTFLRTHKCSRGTRLGAQSEEQGMRADQTNIA